MNAQFKVGDRVVDVRFGFGVVVEIKSGDWPVVVSFDSGRREAYTNGGKTLDSDHAPTLHHVNSAASFDTTELPKLEIDQPVWVRYVDDGDWLARHFAGFIDGFISVFANGGTSHSSTDPPLPWGQYRTTDPALDPPTAANEVSP